MILYKVEGVNFQDTFNMSVLKVLIAAAERAELLGIIWELMDRLEDLLEKFK